MDSYPLELHDLWFGQNVLAMSGAYGVYMAVSSNLRYQILAGIVEERGIDRMFSGSPQVKAAITFIARTGNTYLGSLLWVDFLRMTGLQKVHTFPPVESEVGKKPKK